MVKIIYSVLFKTQFANSHFKTRNCWIRQEHGDSHELAKAVNLTNAYFFKQT